MTDKPENFPAFTGSLEYIHHGITMRDYFAGQAPQGLLTACLPDLKGETIPQVVAETAYDIADAMLRARGSDDSS